MNSPNIKEGAESLCLHPKQLCLYPRSEIWHPDYSLENQLHTPYIPRKVLLINLQHVQCILPSEQYGICFESILLFSNLYPLPSFSALLIREIWHNVHSVYS